MPTSAPEVTAELALSPYDGHLLRDEPVAGRWLRRAIAAPAGAADDLLAAAPAAVSAPAFRSRALLAKRGLDIAGATLGLLALLPLFAIVAVAIKLDSRGPVLFRQTRIGHRHRPFTMLKFRTMHVGAHALRGSLGHLNESPGGLFKITDDPRRTRVGCWLRRLHLDELPQLLHVLTGKMSLVGARPLLPEEDAEVPMALRRRLDLPPGMTGAWQVSGQAHQLTIPEMALVDADYVAGWTPVRDLDLLVATLVHVLAGRGK